MLCQLRRSEASRLVCLFRQHQISTSLFCSFASSKRRMHPRAALHGLNKGCAHRRKHHWNIHVPSDRHHCLLFLLWRGKWVTEHWTPCIKTNLQLTDSLPPRECWWPPLSICKFSHSTEGNAKQNPFCHSLKSITKLAIIVWFLLWFRLDSESDSRYQNQLSCQIYPPSKTQCADLIPLKSKV